MNYNNDIFHISSTHLNVAEKAVGKNASPSPDTMHSPSPQKSEGMEALLILSDQFRFSQNALRYSSVPHCDESCDKCQNSFDPFYHLLTSTVQTRHCQFRQSPHPRPCFSPLPDSQLHRNPRQSLLGQPSLGRLSPVNR